MSEWLELSGFPKTYESRCAAVASVVRIVNGETETKKGKVVILSGAKAFAQQLENELITRYYTTKEAERDVATIVNAVFDENAKHIDEVQWCRLRGAELDVAIRIYASRGTTRLHLSLKGPLGIYADAPLPEHAGVPKTKARKAKAAKAEPPT